MAKILDGKQVVAALNAQLRERVCVLSDKGIVPTLAIVRVGERSDDIAYERGAGKRCETIGVKTRNLYFPQDVTQQQLLDAIEEINQDTGIHGCLLFRPLPGHIDDSAVRNALCPKKDVDGITDGSLAGVFAGVSTGFAPCTPSACLEILDFFGIELKGKKVTVIGRSLVVGKPVAIMLLQRHATVTICHTRTVDMPSVCRTADILLVAAGRAGIVGSEYFSEGQIVIDVGINVDENGSLCGDVNFREAEPVVGAITPVPGGVGTVTTSVLVKHTVEAAERLLEA